MSRGENAMITRRNVLRGATAILTTGALGAWSTRSFAADTVTLPFENGERPLVKYPQKRPMIGLTSRPPQLETPFSVFDEGVITPNDAFFVRYHLAGIPLSIDPGAFRIEVKRKVDHPLSFSLTDLKTGFEPVAVNQCSETAADSLSLVLRAGQLGNGAM